MGYWPSRRDVILGFSFLPKALQSKSGEDIKNEKGIYGKTGAASPVPNEPSTIGGHLRRRRLQLKIFQSEAARSLTVSTVTLSRWECDKVFPTSPHHARVIQYLGYNPFNRMCPRREDVEAVGLFLLKSDVGEQVIVQIQNEYSASAAPVRRS